MASGSSSRYHTPRRSRRDSRVSQTRSSHTPRTTDGGNVEQSTQLIYGSPPSRSIGQYSHNHNVGSLGPAASSLRVRNHDFFKPGRVLITDWTEPRGRSLDTSAFYQAGIPRDEEVFSKRRRFVVIRKYPKHCLALGIFTYTGRGATPGTLPYHSIIYTGRQEPPLTEQEDSYDEEMQPIAIRVNADRNIDKLDERSRLNYSKMYTIEYNIPVAAFGLIHDDYLVPLGKQLIKVQALSASIETEDDSAVVDTTRRLTTVTFSDVHRSDHHEEDDEDSADTTLSLAVEKLIAQIQAKKPNRSRAEAIDIVRQWRSNVSSSQHSNMARTTNDREEVVEEQDEEEDENGEEAEEVEEEEEEEDEDEEGEEGEEEEEEAIGANAGDTHDEMSGNDSEDEHQP